MTWCSVPTMAREMGRLDVGQTVVVKRGAVLAVEAIEGTDQAIRRGGSLGGGGVVVVKVAKPQQDLRFDVPAIGVDTVVSCLDAGAKVLAVEAGKPPSSSSSRKPWPWPTAMRSPS